MIPDDFKRIEGRMYIKKHFLDIEPGDEILIGYIDDSDSVKKLREIIESAEKEAKKEKHLREGMEKLKERLKKKKLEDHMSEHMAAVLHELRHAMHNHPDDKWPWKSFDFVHQTAVMMEEAGEAVRAANNLHSEGGNQMALYGELAQTAAMCLRIMEQIKEFSIYGENSD